MKFKVDHDLHIHSQISLCSNDPEQTTESILKYAERNGFKTICLTDHFWDDTVEGASDWYALQNYEHISKALPLPQSDNVRFLFGVETEQNRAMTVGVSSETMEKLDFIIVPTTHFHMGEYVLTPEDLSSPENRAKAWVRRFESLLDMDVPFHKMGVAHLTCGLIAPTRDEYLRTLDSIPDSELERVFRKAAQVGIGIELNSGDMNYEESEGEHIMRIFAAAKRCGCKFYCGSDSHHPENFENVKEIFERAVDRLGLEESDKIDFLKQF